MSLPRVISVAKVYQHRANTVPMVAVRPQYTDTVPTWYRHHGHTATIHNVVAWWPCTVSTQQLYISCGHGVRVPWPHGNRSYCLGTISAYCSHMATVHTVWVRYLCGYRSVYHSHTATVPCHGHTATVWAVLTQCPHGDHVHLTWWACSVPINPVLCAVRCPSTWCHVHKVTGPVCCVHAVTTL